jgi:hypothetical protein
LIDELRVGLSPKVSEEVYGRIDLLAAARAGILGGLQVRRVVKLSDEI